MKHDLVATRPFVRCAPLPAGFAAAPPMGSPSRVGSERLAMSNSGTCVLDPLTSLPERHSFIAIATQAVASSEPMAPTALLVVAADNLAAVNDSQGFAAGDAAIAQLARLCSARLAPGKHLLGRDGDQILALLWCAHGAPEAKEIAQNIVEDLAQQARSGAAGLSVTCSVGLATVQSAGKNFSRLLRDASAALAHVKRNGGNNFAIASRLTTRSADIRSRLLTAARTDWQQLGFSVELQPIVDLSDGRWHAVEVLLRWEDASLGTVSPGEFIPIAEEGPLILDLGLWAAEQVAQLPHQASRRSVQLPAVFMNLSTRQLLDARHMKAWRRIMSEQAGGLQIGAEITASTPHVATERAARAVRELIGMGASVYLDDFGDGCWPLTSVIDLAVTGIKLDRRLIIDSSRDARALTVCQSLIEMARNLGLHAVAKCVETAAQETWLKHLKCDSAQGTQFAAPMSPDRLFEALQAAAPNRTRDAC